MPPDIGKGGLSDIAAVQIQEPARLDNAGMRNKTEGRAAKASTGYRIQSMGIIGHGDALFAGALPKDPIVMRRTGSLELKRGLFLLVIKPVQRVFIFLCRNRLVDNILAPARGYQQKNVQRSGPQVLSQLQNVGDLIVVVFADGGIDLKLDPLGFCRLYSPEGAFECAFNSANAVMTLFCGAIQAHADAL